MLAIYGRREWIGAACIAVPLAVAALAGNQPLIAGLAVAAWLLVAAFFRDPKRDVPSGPGLFVSPADGRVTHVERLKNTEYGTLLGTDEVIRLSIFLSVANVHINRSPCALVVRDVIYRKGRFGNAASPQSAERNEANMIVCQASDEHGGIGLIVRQVAGLIARRIVCVSGPETRLGRGDKFGMIKFGSRTELFLPADAGVKIVVSVGEHVRAGSSIVARQTERPMST